MDKNGRKEMRHFTKEGFKLGSNFSNYFAGHNSNEEFAGNFYVSLIYQCLPTENYVTS